MTLLQTIFMTVALAHFLTSLVFNVIPPPWDVNRVKVVVTRRYTGVGSFCGGD